MARAAQKGSTSKVYARSYSVALKRIHVTVNARDTTVSMDLTLFEHLRVHCEQQGTTVKRWVQEYIDELLKASPRIDRRSTSLSRRIQAQAIKVMSARMAELVSELALLSQSPRAQRDAMMAIAAPNALPEPFNEKANDANSPTEAPTIKPDARALLRHRPARAPLDAPS